jgi:hypothetical protein
MRASVVLALMTACGSRSAPTSTGGTIGPTAGLTQGLAAPHVATAASLTALDGAPPIVVILDAKGQRYLAAAESWTDLSAGKLSSGPKAAGPDAAAMTITEAVGLERAPKEAVDKFVDFRIGREVQPGGLTDDPPPPEEEEAEHDDESGGTGTALAFEEGKMGKDPPAKNDPIAGQRGWVAAHAQGPGAPAQPTRQATIAGEVTSAKPEDVRAVVVAAPTGKASVLVQVITETHGLIAVMHGGQLRPLRIMFHPRGDVSRAEVARWLEARLETTGVVVEAVPSPSTTIAWADLRAGKLAGARDLPRLEAQIPVDVLVTPDIDVQRLIDALVALDAAGARVIGLGLAPKPGSDEAKLRGRSIPAIAIGTPSSQGDLDKAVIHAKVREHRPKLTHCYEQALLAKPALAGTVIVKFFIRPDGKVAAATASGVDPDIASCVADVIKEIEFPKSNSGGAQVSYPFVFRQ